MELLASKEIVIDNINTESGSSLNNLDKICTKFDGYLYKYHSRLKKYADKITAKIMNIMNSYDTDKIDKIFSKHTKKFFKKVYIKRELSKSRKYKKYQIGYKNARHWLELCVYEIFYLDSKAGMYLDKLKQKNKIKKPESKNIEKDKSKHPQSKLEPYRSQIIELLREPKMSPNKIAKKLTAGNFKVSKNTVINFINDNNITTNFKNIIE